MFTDLDILLQDRVSPQTTRALTNQGESLTLARIGVSDPKTLNPETLQTPTTSRYQSKLPAYSLHCSSFLGLLFRILNIKLVKPKKKGTTMETTGESRSLYDVGSSVWPRLDPAINHKSPDKGTTSETKKSAPNPEA